MIRGTVTENGVPLITLEIAGRQWPAIVDTGFNGDLELPEALRPHVDAKSVGTLRSWLAAGQSVVEEMFRVQIPFDGETAQGEAAFVPGDRILVGTRLLSHHRLEIDFPTAMVRLERANTDN